MARRNLPPAVVEVTRGDLVESRHLVDVAVADADGRILRLRGSGEDPVFPRSAIKALQALPFVQSGAADRFGLADRHIALACASHNGEPIHVEAAREMLTAAGLEPACLECGAHWPKRDEDRNAIVLSGGKPAALHNNCSGKHSGFLCFAVSQGWKTQGYVKPGHKVQKAIAAVLTAETGAGHVAENRGTDGCSIPTYAIPLKNLAAAFARFGVSQSRDRSRAAAMTRIREACWRHPEMVAGAGRFDTALMRALKGRVFTKTGAEGVYVASLPEKGLGIALKARDGAGRAAEIAIAAEIGSLLELSTAETRALNRLAHPHLRNWNGIEIGGLRPAGT
jgi:L-asparaginase II